MNMKIYNAKNKNIIIRIYNNKKYKLYIYIIMEMYNNIIYF